MITQLKKICQYGIYFTFCVFSGLVFSLFSSENALASEYIYQLNWERNDIGNGQSLQWQFATSTLNGTIKSLTYRAENFVGSNNPTKIYVASTTTTYLGECNNNDNGISLGDNKYKFDTTNCNILNDFTFNPNVSYQIELHIGNGDSADLIGTDTSSNSEITETYNGIGYLKLEMTGAEPVIGLMHPLEGFTYGNPVKFEGGFTNTKEYWIYSGNEIDTTDHLIFSGFSANGLNENWTIDMAAYMATGTNYINVILEGTNGTATTSYMFEVDNSISNWGTSTIPNMPRHTSSNTNMASTTANDFFDGFFTMTETSCNFDIFSVWSTTTWKTCAIGTFTYLTEWASEKFINLAQSALRKWPWGYGYRVYEIIKSDTATSTAPNLEFTFPADMGLPTSVVGRTFEFNPIESYDEAVTLIRDSSPTTNEGDMYDTVLWWWNFFCYLAFGFWLWHRITADHNDYLYDR